MDDNEKGTKQNMGRGKGRNTKPEGKSASKPKRNPGGAILQSAAGKTAKKPRNPNLRLVKNGDEPIKESKGERRQEEKRQKEEKQNEQQRGQQKRNPEEDRPIAEEKKPGRKEKRVAAKEGKEKGKKKPGKREQLPETEKKKSGKREQLSETEKKKSGKKEQLSETGRKKSRKKEQLSETEKKRAGKKEQLSETEKKKFGKAKKPSGMEADETGKTEQQPETEKKESGKAEQPPETEKNEAGKTERLPEAGKKKSGKAGQPEEAEKKKAVKTGKLSEKGKKKRVKKKPPGKGKKNPAQSAELSMSGAQRAAGRGGGSSRIQRKIRASYDRGERAYQERTGPIEWFVQNKSLVIIGLTVLAVISLLIAGYRYVVTNYKVTTVYVDGNVHYTNEEVMDMVMEGKYGDNSLFLAAKYRDKGVEGIPFVERMDVNILTPNTIRISVYEKALAGYVEYLGRYMYFDRDGIVVESSEERTAGIPQVTGLKFSYVVLNESLPVENEEIFKRILDITQLLNKYELAADKIFFDSTYDLTLYFGGVRVTLGSNEDIDRKIIRLKSILPKLEGETGTLRMENYTEDTKNITFHQE